MGSFSTVGGVDIEKLMTKEVYDPDDDGVIAVAQTEADMKKSVYDPNEDGKIALSIIDINADLAMGAHNITLDAGKTVDGIDVSNHTHTLTATSVSVAPTLYEPSVSQGNEYLVGTVDHNFTTTESLISYCVDFDAAGASDETYYVRIYVDGELKLSREVTVPAHNSKRAQYGEVIDVGTTGTKTVDLKVYVDYIAESRVVHGKNLVVQSYNLGAPS